MKAFLLCTPSHRKLLAEHLIPTLPLDIDIFIKQGRQHCESGRYMSDGWLACMRDKVELLIQAVDDNPGECLLHLDADVQFFVPRIEPILLRYLDRCDLVAQSDGEGDRSEVYCGGFFAFRANEAIRELFEQMLLLMGERRINDQEALNQAIHSSEVAADLLNSDHFWSPRSGWKPGMPLNLSPSAVFHHANWCVGVEDKVQQLNEGARLHTLWRGLERHGSHYGGKWVRAGSLHEDSVVYSAGVGEDISFDISLLDRYGLKVFAFDPTPRAIDFASAFAQDDPDFRFFHYGISARQAGTAPFFKPKNPDHVSCSIFDTGGERIDLPLKSIDKIMTELGHTRIDLFKMDIEGAEYEVIEHMLSMSPPLLPGQLLVEFHDSLAPELGARKTALIRSILSRGYELTYQEGCEYSFFLTPPELKAL